MPVGIAGVGGKIIFEPTPDPPIRVPDEPDESDEPPADAPADDDAEAEREERRDRTLDQLRTGSGGKTVDRKPIFGTDDIDVRPGEWPIGFPLQGIPRVAVTVNLNYVYDEERGEWTRQSPFDGGGGGMTQLATGTVSFNFSTFQRIPTGVTDLGIDAHAGAEVVSFTGTESSITIAQSTLAGADAEVGVAPEFNVSAGEWDIFIDAIGFDGQTEVRWRLYDLSTA